MMKTEKAAQSLLQTLVMLPLLYCFVFAAESSIIAKPGCIDICGDVMVPYPFGIDKLSCAKNESFLFICNRTSSPHTLMFNETIPILNISVETNKMVAKIDSAYNCSGGGNDNHPVQSHNLTNWPFTFSNTDNMFTVVGCDAVALFSDNYDDATFASGCNSLCTEAQNFTKVSKCTGIGCCQSPVPMYLKSLWIYLASTNVLTDISSSGPCNYAFLVENKSLDLSETRLESKTPVHLSPPVVLDWVVFGDKDCAGQCSDNAHCNYSDNGRGYGCSCKNGYEGNPYLPKGCRDINECNKLDKYTCHGSCKNTDGDYICSCPIGMYGDGKDSCQGFYITTIVAAVIGGIILLAIISLLIFIICNKRKKQNNFLRNGGELMKNQRVRIFSEAELETATKSYDKDRLLGEGGFGYVYKGVLDDGAKTEIAVKKPKDENKIQISTDFWHEMTTVSQINHKNVVKLLGLCLETKVPLLVYEFISNGTLFEHIHDKKSSLLQSWKNRLRVASETAFALDYLHSAADPPIIHSDVKSMNVLIDENHTAKVSDFGASVLISPGETALATKIQGTLGYLDPEYLMTGILTEKSDVYSFGVLLVELLTGEKPTSNARSGEKRNIVQYFISTAETDNLFEILGFDVYDEGEKEEIKEVAELAKRCLNANGIMRPTMKEVADDLARLKRLNESLRAQSNDTEETELLLGESLYYSGENVKAKAQMGEPNSYTFASFDIESSVTIAR